MRHKGTPGGGVVVSRDMGGGGIGGGGNAIDEGDGGGGSRAGAEMSGGLVANEEEEERNLDLAAARLLAKEAVADTHARDGLLLIQHASDLTDVDLVQNYQVLALAAALAADDAEALTTDLLPFADAAARVKIGRMHDTLLNKLTEGWTPQFV